MKKAKFFISLILASVLIISQAAVVFAAPTQAITDPITGTVQGITLETDPNTGVTTVLVEVLEGNVYQTVRISLETALDPDLGLVILDEDGNPFINEEALGLEIVIDPAMVIPDDEEPEHPVGSALATFFSDITDLDYDAIMTAHENGFGFGVIAQALWITRKLGGNASNFALILDVKKSGDYSNIIWSDGTVVSLPDGTVPTNWGQFRKAAMDKSSLGMVMSHKDKDIGNNGNGNVNGNNNGNGNAKDKNKDKDNNGNGHGNGNGNGNKP